MSHARRFVVFALPLAAVAVVAWILWSSGVGHAARIATSPSDRKPIEAAAGARSEASEPATATGRSENVALREMTTTPAADSDATVDPSLLLVIARSLDGAPVEGVGIELSALDSSPLDGRPAVAPRRISVTLPMGIGVIPGLQPGRHRLRVHGFEVQRLEREIELDGGVRIYELRITLAAAPVVDVRLEDERGAPIDDPAELGLAIAATRREVGPKLPLSGGDAALPIGHGLYLWNKASASGRLRLFEPLPAYVVAASGGRRLDGQWVAPGATSVTLRIDRAALKSAAAHVRARIVETDGGAPIPHARLKISTWSGEREASESDQAGVVRCDVASAGFRKLHVVAAGHETIAQWVALEAGQTLDLGDVALAPAQPLQLQLVDEDGPIDRGAVEVRRLDAYRPPWWTALGESFVADEEGIVELRELGRARYLIVPSDVDVRPRRHDALDPVLVDLRDAHPDRVECRRQTGIDVTFRCEPARDADASERWSLEVCDAAGLPVVGLPIGDECVVALARGRHVARLLRGETPVQRVEFTVGDAPRVVTFAVEGDPPATKEETSATGASIELRPLPDGDPSFGHVAWGCVREEGGALQVLHEVAVVQPKGARSRGAVAAGAWFACAGLPAGPVQLELELDDGRHSTASLEVAEEPPVQRHDLTLERRKTFDVRIVTTDPSLIEFLEESRVRLRLSSETQAASDAQDPQLARIEPDMFDPRRFKVDCTIDPPFVLTLYVDDEVAVSRPVAAIEPRIELALPADLARRRTCDWEVDLADRDTLRPVVPTSVIDRSAARMRALDRASLSSHLLISRVHAGAHTIVVAAEGYETLTMNVQLEGGILNDLGTFHLEPKKQGGG